MLPSLFVQVWVNKSHNGWHIYCILLKYFYSDFPGSTNEVYVKFLHQVPSSFHHQTLKEGPEGKLFERNKDQIVFDSFLTVC